jgi:hypothetical protein
LLWSHSRNSLDRSFHESCGPLACGSKVRTFERAGKTAWYCLSCIGRHTCVARRISAPIANLAFRSPDGESRIWTALSSSLSCESTIQLNKHPLKVLPPRRTTHPYRPKTPSTVTNLSSLHQPSDITNGPPPPRLNHASDGNNAIDNANDLLHLHHHTPLHHRLETHNPIPLRLDLPLSRPPLHSLPRSASSKMQFASLLASSRPSREEKGSGAGTVVLCGRRS